MFWGTSSDCARVNSNYLSLINIQLQEVLGHPAFEVKDAVVVCIDLIKIIVVKSA